MSRFMTFMILLATLGWALAGCESKDPDQPNLKGAPNPNYPRPGVAMGGSPPPSGSQKGGDEKGGESKMDDSKMDDHKDHEGKTDEGKEKAPANDKGG